MTKIWYGDKPNRKCSDCGEHIDWDERLRLGYYAKGGPTHNDGITPLYDPQRSYGNTLAGQAEQAKLNTHHERFHRGGIVTETTIGGWDLTIHRYDAGLAYGRKCLVAKQPFYGILKAGGSNASVTFDAAKTAQQLIDYAQRYVAACALGVFIRRVA